MMDPILVVEDYDIDFQSAARSFQRAGLSNPVIRASTAAEALAWLDRNTPAFVLLDLNLPDCMGTVLLDRLKSDPDRRKIPVVVWSGNEQDECVAHAYQLGANSFIPKRMQPMEQRRDIENIVHFWFESVQLPRNAN